jgi:hypothetical protein
MQSETRKYKDPETLLIDKQIKFTFFVASANQKKLEPDFEKVFGKMIRKKTLPVRNRFINAK